MEKNNFGERCNAEVVLQHLIKTGVLSVDSPCGLFLSRDVRQHERSSKGVPGAVFPTSLRGEGKSHQVHFARRKGERFWVRVRLVWRGLQCTPVGNGDERCRTLFLPVSADRLRLSLETGKGYQVLLFQRHSRQLR